MIPKDYLLRLIEEAAQVLAQALGLRNRGEYQRALLEIGNAVSGLFGLEEAKGLELPQIYLLTGAGGGQEDTVPLSACCQLWVNRRPRNRPSADRCW